MSTDRPLIISISPGDVVRQDDVRPVTGGNSRMVKMVPVGNGNHLPCIIRSRVAVTTDNDGRELSAPSNECLLLVSRDPYLTLRAYVETSAWRSFPEQPLEW
jgi:hypothetical protein